MQFELNFLREVTLKYIKILLRCKNSAIQKEKCPVITRGKTLIITILHPHCTYVFCDY